MVTATSGRAIFVDTLRGMVSRSSAFQGAVGASNAAEALPFIYLDIHITEENHGQLGVPCAVICQLESRWDLLAGGASHSLWPTRVAWLCVLLPKDAYPADAEGGWEEGLTHANIIGGIEEDIAEAAGDGSGDTLSIDSMVDEESPQFTPPEYAALFAQPIYQATWLITCGGTN